MATKAGMVKFSDCINGKTFHQVRITIDSNGGFSTDIHPIYCCSRGIKKSLKGIKDPHTKQMYLKNPLVYFEHNGLKKAMIRDMYAGTMFNAFSYPLTANIKYISRLFTTQAYAERFIQALNLTFVPSNDQQWAVLHQDRWEKEYYKEAMADLELSILPI